MNLYTQQTETQIQMIKDKYHDKKLVFCCSAFDLLHCGHIIMLEDAKNHGDILIVGLQTNPNIDRASKNVPIQSYVEHEIQIKGCRYVDEVIQYATESDLYKILCELKPDIRVLGTDWLGKPYTGHDLPIPVHWHNRNHQWSTTWLRERIYQAEHHKYIS
jgi:glycerol-3-phosphate cytidylyltransferase